MTNKLLAVVCALGFAVLPLDASARTHSAILGNPNDSADATCFDDINQGIINVCTGPRTWSVPIIWDTTTALGPKTVIVNSQFAPGGALSCTYRGFTANGSLFLTIPFPAFSAANPSRSIAVNNVPASSFGHVSCTMSPFSTVLLASVNYAPQ